MAKKVSNTRAIVGAALMTGGLFLLAGIISAVFPPAAPLVLGAAGVLSAGFIAKAGKTVYNNRKNQEGDKAETKSTKEGGNSKEKEKTQELGKSEEKEQTQEPKQTGRLSKIYNAVKSLLSPKEVEEKSQEDGKQGETSILSKVMNVVKSRFNDESKESSYEGVKFDVKSEKVEFVEKDGLQQAQKGLQGVRKGKGGQSPPDSTPTSESQRNSASQQR